MMKPSKPYVDPMTRKRRYLSPNQMPVQKEMIKLIIYANNRKYPIYMAATVGEDIRSIVGKYLSREGMAYRIMPEEHDDVFNIAITDSLLNKVFRYTNVDNPDVHFGDTELAMAITYPEMYILVSDQLLSSKDTAGAIEWLKKAIDKFPFYYRTAIKLRAIYLAQGKIEEGQKELREALNRIKPLVQKYPDDILWHLFLGPLYLELGQLKESILEFERALEINHDERMVLASLLTAYQRAGENDKAIRLLERWKKAYPNDRNIRQIYSYYRSRFK